MKNIATELAQMLSNLIAQNRWGRGRNKKLGVLLLGVGALIVLNCGPKEQVIGTYQFNEEKGVALPEKVIIFEQEFAPKQFYKNQFLIKHQEEIIPCYSTIVELHTDKSIKKVRFFWVIKDVKPNEKRNYQIMAYSGRRSKSSHLKQLDNTYLIDLAGQLKLGISSNGLSKIQYASKNLEIQDVIQINDEKNIVHLTKYSKNARIRLIKENDFLCQFEVSGTTDSLYEYSQIYTFFYQIPIILYIKNVKFQKDAQIQLAEVFSLNLINFKEVMTYFYGWKKQSARIKSGMDVYDYKIAQNPDSYLFLSYLKDEITGLKYHFVARKKSRQQRDNLFTTVYLDSSLCLSILIPDKQWKRHSTFHIASDSLNGHISWHWHGFQRREHWNRFYRQNWNEFWPADSLKTFTAFYFFHSPELSDQNLQELLHNYNDLTNYFK